MAENNALVGCGGGRRGAGLADALPAANRATAGDRRRAAPKDFRRVNLAPASSISKHASLSLFVPLGRVNERSG